jgi:hypothetical protein
VSRAVFAAIDDNWAADKLSDDGMFSLNSMDRNIRTKKKFQLNFFLFKFFFCTTHAQSLKLLLKSQMMTKNEVGTLIN